MRANSRFGISTLHQHFDDAAEVDFLRKPETQCAFLSAMAQSAGALVVAGRVATDRRSLTDLKVGLPTSAPPPHLLSVVLETFANAADAEETCHTTLETFRQKHVLWLHGEACLIAVSPAEGDMGAFVALVDEEPLDGFTPWRRDLMRLGLVRQREELAHAPSQGPDRPDEIIEQVMRRFAIGFAVIDARTTVRFVNDAARAFLQRHSDPTIAEGRLVVRDGALRDALVAATSGRSRRPHVHLLSQPDGGGMAGAVAITPIDLNWPLALLSFTDPNDTWPAHDPTLEAFGLTRAERRLGRLLVSGRRLADAAKASNITTATARSYLKRIFSKTGTQRQSEFVALVRALTTPAIRLAAD